MATIYFLVGKTIFLDGCWENWPTFIGTETTLPLAFDNHSRRIRERTGRVPDPNVITRSRTMLRKIGAFYGDHEVRQMEGGPDDARRLYEHFEHLRYDPDEIHVYYADAEMHVFIEEHTEAWTGENAVALGMPKPKRSHEDREAPISLGLAGRLKRRSG